MVIGEAHNEGNIRRFSRPLQGRLQQGPHAVVLLSYGNAELDNLTSHWLRHAKWPLAGAPRLSVLHTASYQPLSGELSAHPTWIKPWLN
jgi:hypothetical protein